MNYKVTKEQGITLVALIITIIILIILAAVSIKAVLDMNFVDLASNAVLNYTGAQVEEGKNINEIDSFLQSTIKKIEDDNSNIGGGESPNPSGDPKPTPIPTPSGPHLPVIPPASDKAGINVNYVAENGTYPKEILDKYSGSQNNNDFTTDTSLKWKVWSIDNNNLYLISDKPISTGGNNNGGKLALSNHLGYNNGVTLLDEICSTCYNNISYGGLTARSLKIEDVLAVITVNSAVEDEYGTQPHEYDFTYPYIWTEYESQTKENALNNRSIAYKLTTNTVTPQAKQNPYWTLWYSHTSMNSTSAYKYGKYKELLTDVVSNYGTYWLSSRCANPFNSDVCRFGLEILVQNGLDFNYLFSKFKEGPSFNEFASGIRPFITIPLSSCTITEVDADNWTIAPKA